jgi:hypothetical protein
LNQPKGWLTASIHPLPKTNAKNQAAELFDSFVPIDEEDRQNMPLEGIVEFASAIGIDDPEAVRPLHCITLVMCVVSLGQTPFGLAFSLTHPSESNNRTCACWY